LQWERTCTNTCKCSWNFLLAEKADHTVAEALQQDPNQGHRLLLKTAQCLAACASHGLLLSDCGLQNLGCMGDRVVVIDCSRDLVDEPIGKSMLNVKVMKKLWRRAEAYCTPETIAHVQSIWQSSYDIATFISHNDAQASTPTPESSLSRDYYPWSNDSSCSMGTVASAADQSCNNNEPPIATEVRTGLYVDSVTLLFRNQTVTHKTYGNLVGGNKLVREMLCAGETICTVRVWRAPNDGVYVGRKLEFVLSSGRTLSFCGEHVGKHNSLTELHADVARSPVCGLVFSGETLTGLEYGAPRARRSPPPPPSVSPTRQPFSRHLSQIVIISDSTLGFYFSDTSDFGIKEIAVEGGPVMRIYYKNGAAMRDIVPHLNALKSELKPSARRILYVPMERSLNPEKQRHYAAHEQAQTSIFADTTFLRLPCLLDLEEQYGGAKESEWDQHPHFYRSRGLHLRRPAADFLAQWLYRNLQRGDVVFMLGWNAKDPIAEFTEQRRYGEAMLKTGARKS
jgi:hypothetical protein